MKFSLVVKVCPVETANQRPTQLDTCCACSLKGLADSVSVVVVVVEVREASASLCATEESLPSERDHLARFLCQVREFDVNVSEYSHSCFCCSVAH